MTQSASNEIYSKYVTLFLALKEVIIISERRVIDENPDDLFIDNVNFFVKSYLISICSYLEAYLQDVAFKYSQEVSNRITCANIPHNFIHWRMGTSLKDKQLKYADIELPVSKKDISDNISANPYRTLKLFQFLGVDLSRKDDFEFNKDLIYTIVTKRNNIIHHNDRAADVSFGDLISYIEVIVPYMKAVKEATFCAELN
ncbi:MAG: HEPN domain-containing protein [Nodosilinea sp.]